MINFLNFDVKLPQNAYFVRTRPEHHVLSCNYKDRRYLVAFVFDKDARHVCKTVSINSAIEIQDTIPTVMIGKSYNSILSEELNVLKISKKININKLPCYVQAKSFVEVLSLPWIQNVGIAFAYDLLEESTDENKYESQLIHPTENLQVFRKALSASIEDQDNLF